MKFQSYHSFPPKLQVSRFPTLGSKLHQLNFNISEILKIYWTELYIGSFLNQNNWLKLEPGPEPKFG